MIPGVVRAIPTIGPSGRYVDLALEATVWLSDVEFFLQVFALAVIFPVIVDLDRSFQAEMLPNRSEPRHLNRPEEEGERWNKSKMG